MILEISKWELFKIMIFCLFEDFFQLEVSPQKPTGTLSVNIQNVTELCNWSVEGVWSEFNLADVLLHIFKIYLLLLKTKIFYYNK